VQHCETRLWADLPEDVFGKIEALLNARCLPLDTQHICHPEYSSPAGADAEQQPRVAQTDGNNEAGFEHGVAPNKFKQEAMSSKVYEETAAADNPADQHLDTQPSGQSRSQSDEMGDFLIWRDIRGVELSRDRNLFFIRVSILSFRDSYVTLTIHQLPILAIGVNLMLNIAAVLKYVHLLCHSMMCLSSIASLMLFAWTSILLSFSLSCGPHWCL
jgi:hypothetical protein